MRFGVTIPDPHTMRAGTVAYVTLAPGTELHRVHPGVFGPAQFNPTENGNARFSPIRDAAGTVIPTIYGAQSFECAVCEIILRCPDVPTVTAAGPPPLCIVSPGDFAGYGHSTVRTAADLDLVDLTIAGQRRIGINGNAILAGPRSTYPATRRWAERIHALCPAAHGLYYTSYQYGPAYAVLLFGDRLAPGALTPGTTRAIADAACHGEIRHLARNLCIDYVAI